VIEIRGVVKFYYIDKNWGFIKGSDKDIFVHKSNLILEPFLKTGDIVEFAIEETERGLMAVNVIKIN